MAKFIYKAKTKENTIVKGAIEASTKEEVMANLKKEQLTPLEIEKKFSLGEISIGGKKISIKDRYLFTQQLAVMIRSGLPIVEALTILSEESDNKNLKHILKQIATDIKGGKAISQAFNKTEAFPNYYVAVLKSGEKSGKLDNILIRLADHMNQDYQLRSKLRSALILPAVVLTVMLVVIVVILVFVLPQLMALFTESNVKLPLATRILIGSSNFLTSYWYIVLITITILYIGLHFYRKSTHGKQLTDKIKLKVPIFGKLTKMVTMSRLTGTIATLTSSGMPILEIIETCEGIVDNSIYKQILVNGKKQLERGKSLAEALSNKKYIPPLVSHMLKIGEKSGNIEYVLTELSKFYEEESNAMTKNMMTLMEPVITVVLGVGVAFIVLSVLSPIYQLVNATS